MGQLVLRQDIIEKIKNDQILYGHVAKLAGHTILSMRRVLNENRSPRLVQPTVLKLLMEYLNIEDQDELLESVGDDDDNNNTSALKMQAHG